MNGDDMGEVGESFFRQTAAQCGLIANKSDRDRTGWDFIVEWPMPKDSKLSLDQRSTFDQVLMQVKSALADTKAVRFRLSSIERLVKSPSPAFVFIPRYREDGELHDLSLAHIGREVMELVLARLRQAEIDGDKPNDLYISLSISKYSQRLSNSRELKRRIENTILDFEQGDAYSPRKLSLLKGLGYEESSSTFKVTFNNVNEEDIIDAFLGISTVEGDISDAKDLRFNLPIPLQGFPVGRTELNFNPVSSGKAQLSFRRNQVSRALRFSGNFYTAPAELQTNIQKFLVRLELNKVVLRFSNKEVGSRLSITITSDEEAYRNKRLDASTWQEYFDLQGLLDGGRVLIDIVLGLGRHRLSGAADVDQSSTKPAKLANARSALSGMQRLLSHLGLEREKFNIKALNPSFSELIFLHHIFCSSESALLTFSSEEVAPEITLEEKMAVVFQVQLNELNIGVVCTADFSAELSQHEYNWIGRNVCFGFAREVGFELEDLEALALEAQTVLSTRRSILLQRAPGEDTGDVTIYGPS